MAIAVSPEPLDSRWIPVDDRHGWGFLLLSTTTATLFLRPADLVPALDHWPIYQFLILACLVVAARSILRHLAFDQLNNQPVTACLFWLLVSIGMSHLAHGFFWGARASMLEFCKPAAFYFLMIGLINTPQRLIMFCKLLALIITAVACLALLDRYGVLTIAALESIQDRGGSAASGTMVVERIRGTGIFHDPNDFGLILVTGVVLSFAFLSRPGTGWPRYVWLVPTGLLLLVLAMTHSRGAFLSLACGIPAALAYRRGVATGILSVLALPVVGMLFSGRMTDLDALNAGTGQSRIQIWSDSLLVFRQNPLFGLGEGMLVEEYGVVAHNSFIHCFAELGSFGGVAFLSCFLAAGLGLWALRQQSPIREEQSGVSRELRDLAHIRGFVFAALAAYVGGMLALSRQFVTPTFLLLGLATAAHMRRGGESSWRVGNRFLIAAVSASAVALAVFYLAVRLLVRW